MKTGLIVLACVLGLLAALYVSVNVPLAGAAIVCIALLGFALWAMHVG